MSKLRKKLAVVISPNRIWRLCLESIIRVLIGEKKLRLYESTNWEHQSDRFCKTDLIYPQYYSTQNFHGIEGGYLNPIAAITYDLVTAFASPPNETWVRQQLISASHIAPIKIDVLSSLSIRGKRLV